MEPPTTAKLWIAPYGRPPATANFLVINRVSDEEDYGLHVMTAVVHQLGIQLVAWKGHKLLFHARRLKLDGWDNVTRQIWPIPKKRVKWPPSHFLTQASLKTFRNRFKPRDFGV
jgi:hypothetical protein